MKSIIDVVCLSMRRDDHVEPRRDRVRHRRAGGEHIVRAGTFTDILQPGKALDVITFNDVLEHPPAVDDALGATRVALRSGGLRSINTPLRTGWRFA